MRIISGSLKGRQLQSFRGRVPRPTPDRVREALFSILAHKTKGAVVLDLFSGTGALGIEALSRGSHWALFIEKSTDCLAILNANLRRCNLAATTRVMQWDIAKNLDCLICNPYAFDLVFMDPPYGRNLAPPTVTHLAASNCLAKGAIIVVEHEPTLEWAAMQAPIQTTDSRRYGKTQLTFLAYEPHG